MILSNYNTLLDEFFAQLVKAASETESAGSIVALGIHLDPINGAILGGVNTSDPDETNIPDFTRPEIVDLEVPEWGKNYWEGEGMVQLDENAERVSADAGDQVYVEQFVAWAVSVVSRHITENSWPFEGAKVSVHPVGADPVISWRPPDSPQSA